MKLTKNGQVNPFALVAFIFQMIFSNWIVLGIVLLTLGLSVGLFFWKLKVILGVFLIIMAVLARWKGFGWKTTLFFTSLGLFILINPFDIAKLEMMRG